MNLANAYGRQFYYFKLKQEMYSFLKESSQRLGIKGNTRESLKKLEALSNQMQSESTRFAGQNVSPLGLKAGRVKGEALHLQLDARKESLQSLEGKIGKVSGPDGHGGIMNPKFPEGENLETAFSRLAATVKSDGQLRETGRISYTEANEGRINQVERDLQAFGEISLRRLDRGGKQEASFPAPLGRALQNMGFRSGDKGILNDGLPPAIMQSSPRARRTYLQDLIPEDGSFHPTAGFSWTRSNVLNAGAKSEKYGVSDKLSEKAVAFLKDGTPENKSTRRGWGELQKLAKTGHSEAREIVARVRENPNRLIRDEASLARSLGIGVSTKPIRVRVMKKTERVSVQWGGRTSSVGDALKWAKQCPPNDVKKRRAVEKWMNDKSNTSS
jgi:intein/homing endonuclease